MSQGSRLGECSYVPSRFVKALPGTGAPNNAYLLSYQSATKRPFCQWARWTRLAGFKEDPNQGERIGNAEEQIGIIRVSGSRWEDMSCRFDRLPTCGFAAATPARWDAPQSCSPSSCCQRKKTGPIPHTRDDQRRSSSAKIAVESRRSRCFTGKPPSGGRC
jgi:hypothetical protein